MKRNLLLLMVFFSISFYAQEFAPIGAIWHYSQGTINPQFESYKTINSVSDTIIEGINCKMLIEIDREMISPRSFEHFMFIRNDSVYWYMENEFNLIYDFSANQGDTVVLSSSIPTIDGNPLKMIIDSIGSISINNDFRKVQYVTCGDGGFAEFGGMVVSGIGNLNYLFPTFDNETHGPLRCYEDDSLGLFINNYSQHYNWDGQNCEQEIVLSVMDNPLESLSVFPNPTEGLIAIKDIVLPIDYKIFDMAGCVIMNGILTSAEEINLIDFSCGLYILEISSNNHTVFRKIVRY